MSRREGYGLQRPIQDPGHKLPPLRDLPSPFLGREVVEGKLWDHLEDTARESHASAPALCPLFPAFERQLLKMNPSDFFSCTRAPFAPVTGTDLEAQAFGLSPAPLEQSARSASLRRPG